MRNQVHLRIGRWLAVALVAAGAITALIAATVEGTDMPANWGGAWARAEVSVDDGVFGTDEERLVVEMTRRGFVAAPRGDLEAVRAFEGDDERPDFSVDPLAGERQSLGRAVPQSIGILMVDLAIGLMLAAAAIALFPRHLQPLWPVLGATALALLVTAVLLRHLTLGELGSGLADLQTAWGADGRRRQIADFTVGSTTLSGVPVVGAVVSLAGAVLGSVLGEPPT